MARRFLGAFGEIARRGGRTEHGRFVSFYADYPLDPAEQRRWRPPPVPPHVRAVDG